MTKKIALITGANKGLGKEISRQLAANPSVWKRWPRTVVIRSNAVRGLAITSVVEALFFKADIIQRQTQRLSGLQLNQPASGKDESRLFRIARSRARRRSGSPNTSISAILLSLIAKARTEKSWPSGRQEMNPAVPFTRIGRTDRAI